MERRPPPALSEQLYLLQEVASSRPSLQPLARQSRSQSRSSVPSHQINSLAACLVRLRASLVSHHSTLANQLPHRLPRLKQQHNQPRRPACSAAILQDRTQPAAIMLRRCLEAISPPLQEAAEQMPVLLGRSVVNPMLRLLANKPQQRLQTSQISPVQATYSVTGRPLLQTGRQLACLERKLRLGIRRVQTRQLRHKATRPPPACSLQHLRAIRHQALPSSVNKTRAGQLLVVVPPTYSVRSPASSQMLVLPPRLQVFLLLPSHQPCNNQP